MPTIIETNVYEFGELEPDAQENAVEWLTEQNAQFIENDEIEDPDYWQDELLAPHGMEVEKPRNAAWHSGFYWTIYPGPFAWFDARCDLETFIKKHKLGRSHALLLSSIKRGETNSRTSVEVKEHGAVNVEIDSPGFWYPGIYDGDPAPDWVNTPEDRRLQKLDEQSRDMAERISDVASDVASQIARNIGDQYDYLTSEEYARERLEDDPGGYLFLADGSPYTPPRFLTR